MKARWQRDWLRAALCALLIAAGAGSGGSAAADFGARDAADDALDFDGEARARSWRYLIDKLAADGIPRERAVRVFADPRFPPFTGIRFSLAPREPRALYRGFLTSSSVARARMCHAEHAEALEEAERTQGVPASVVAAILHVETACGRNTGQTRILPALARLAMAAEPANLALNIEDHTGAAWPSDSENARATVERARTLEDTFYPEVRATFELAARMNLDPLEIRGSGSGAFGIPQFLPTSYLRYGRDGDGDGRVSLYDTDDAVASCAAYLAAHGWQPGLTLSGRRQVIWHYNHSPAYVDTVLALANRIDAPARTLEASTHSPTHAAKHAGATHGHASKGKASAQVHKKGAAKTAAAEPATAAKMRSARAN